MNGILSAIQHFDMLLLEKIPSLHCSFLSGILPKITLLGNGGILWIIISLALILFPKTRRCGITLALALLMVLIFGNIILKPLVARIRPFDINPDIVLLIKPPSDYSFPSGHTYSSFAAAAVILYHFKKAGVCALIAAIVISFSRLYLQVHFLSDIIAGIALGLLCAAAAIRIVNIKRSPSN